ncbi:hypothetical protein J2Z35_000017 [Acetoanaerobium pronyense]|uniref:Uncharacterized protein n=1 Tax=Acetoanaerobium pronyense TaxID=1482736 RepID=A0ABS4KEN9_9FIRM|nr:hypothetical protein [Acetoanaerobium pronyense]MBP2026228.1 hypothetical protein [Acetoanaerobium pronyense]
MNYMGLGLGKTGITKAHVTGFVVGVGVAATGYYVYMKNKDNIDGFLAQHGVVVPKAKEQDLAQLTLEELLLRKEHIEDLIAEREMEAGEETVVSEG